MHEKHICIPRRDICWIQILTRDFRFLTWQESIIIIVNINMVVTFRTLADLQVGTEPTNRYPEEFGSFSNREQQRV